MILWHVEDMVRVPFIGGKMGGMLRLSPWKTASGKHSMARLGKLECGTIVPCSTSTRKRLRVLGLRPLGGTSGRP